MKILMVGPVRTKKSGGVSNHTEELIKELRKLGNTAEHYKISPKNQYPVLLVIIIKIFSRTIGLIIKLIKDRKRFDIIHVQSSGLLQGFAPAITSSILKKSLNFKLIVTYHYSKTQDFVNKYEKILRYVLKRSHKFIVVSNKQKEIILNATKGSFKDKIIVIPNGYDPERFEFVSLENARKKLKIPKDEFVIVNVAQLLPKKGQKHLIDAMHPLVKDRNKKKILCYIIGTGPLHEELQRQIIQNNLEDNVKLTGRVPLDILVQYLNAADLFALPSLAEGNPTVMFEALSIGLPFIGTKVGGIPEIITSEDYGLFFELADPQDIAEKILIAQEKKWNRKKIRKYAEQFTWDKITKQTLEVYKKTMRGNK